MDTDTLKLAYSPKSFRKQAHELVDLLADYLDTSLNAESDKVIRWQKPEDELRYWTEYLKKGDPNDFFENLMERIIHIHHPRYMGHQISPSLPITGLSGLLSALMNNGMGIYEMGAAPTVMERIVTDSLCEAAGYPKTARGILTSGGSLANLTALISARQQYLSRYNIAEGAEKKLAVMVSDQAHYCIQRAVKIMGLGEEGIVSVPTDEYYQIRADLLEEKLESARSQGIEVFALVGCAPSTATGIYDDLDSMRIFAMARDLWFHVDAAHGGAVIYSSKYKELIKGSSFADSITIDGHKMMMMPGITTALLYRNGQDSHNTFKQKAEYLLEDSEDEDWYNLAKRTFECTKHMMSLHWYVVLKLYGPKIFDEFVTRLYDLAAEFSEIITQDEDFELASAPMSNILCFRYTPEEIPEPSLDELNKKIRQAILEDGTFYVVQTRLRGMQYIRTTIMNPFTTSTHFRALLAKIRDLAGYQS
ncbi:MAG: aminotransferase class I/II-fold pyridoxal phosphate-dependent enzyme [Flavobacteriaceae bacterium]